MRKRSLQKVASVLRDAVGGFGERAHRDELAGDDVA